MSSFIEILEHRSLLSTTFPAANIGLPPAAAVYANNLANSPLTTNASVSTPNAAALSKRRMAVQSNTKSVSTTPSLVGTFSGKLKGPRGLPAANPTLVIKRAASGAYTARIYDYGFAVPGIEYFALSGNLSGSSVAFIANTMSLEHVPGGDTPAGGLTLTLTAKGDKNLRNLSNVKLTISGKGIKPYTWSGSLVRSV